MVLKFYNQTQTDRQENRQAGRQRDRQTDISKPIDALIKLFTASENKKINPAHCFRLFATEVVKSLAMPTDV
jgi:hypothetical protein